MWLIDGNKLKEKAVPLLWPTTMEPCGHLPDPVMAVVVPEIEGMLYREGVEMPEPARWIPVCESLPETIVCSPAGTAYSEAVIVWTSGRKAMIAVWDGEGFLCAADYWEAWDEIITHWMPLPTPPKESTARG